MHAALIPHPTTPSPHIEAMEAHVSGGILGAMSVRYIVRGAIDKIRWPALDAPTRTDALWEHTCFEIFLRARGERSYVELNFSPSTRWAAYRFVDYRSGKTNLDLPMPPQISCRHDSMRMELETTFRLDSSVLATGAELRAALAAVVEDDDGHRSYFAPTHPSARPDFHHADGFTLALRCDGSR